MDAFEIYVHGTPRGHQIWGSEYNYGYISTFYNHDSQVSEKVILQIDICGGDSFYTYMHHQNIFDVEGRPQAFFALTISFHEAYCTNVYRLYQLFDAVYNQICVGAILKRSGNGENFLVADFTVARSGSNATVDKIKAAFTQKIAELIMPTLQPLSSGDTFNKSKKIVSLLEVDSPLFFDYFKKYSLFVLPNMQPAAVAYDSVVSELKQVSAQRKALTSSNEQLQSEKALLSQENKSLSDQLQASVSSTEKKYRNQLDQLQSDLISITDERDSLRRKIKEASSSIELIDQPLQKLTRLLAGRFPENRSSKYDEPVEEKPKVNRKNPKPVRRDWLSIILLGLVLACCCAILVVILRSRGVDQSADVASKADKIAGEVYSATTDELSFTEESSEVPEETSPTYDSWDECILNIKGGSDNLVLNKEYLLSVTKGRKLANVPQGYWSVYIDEGKSINKDNSFIITDPANHGKNIMIEYFVDGISVKKRVCKIQ